MFGKETLKGMSKLKYAIFLCIIAVLIITIVILSIKVAQLENKYVPVNANASENEENSAIPVYEDPAYDVLFNNDNSAKVFLHDPDLGQIWIPLLTDVSLNPYDNANYKTENGLKSYYLNNQKTSVEGIDVSVHQKNIDWNKVKAAGIDFAMIRIGYRGYQTGDTGLDENYITNIEGAINAGIDVGVYFFSQAVSVEEAAEEASLTIDAIKDYDITYPIVYDWEVIYDDVARTDEVTVDTVTDCAITFCETVKQAGYTPMIYASRKCAYLKLDLSHLTNYDFWLAEFNDTTSYVYNYQMWQYSCTGQIDGIEGDVDLNISYIDYGSKTRSERAGLS